MRQRRVIVAVTLMLAGVAVGTLAYATWVRHQGAKERLAEIEPRHARLLGLQAGQAALDAARDKVQEVRSQLVYPSTQDATQAGNAAQQRVRDILTGAGLQVLSSQVLPAKEEKGFDRIALTLRAEGDALAMNSALAVLGGQSPVIVVSEMDAQVQMAMPNAAPRLAIQFTFTVMRERS